MDPHVRWVPAAENRFGVELLDCSAFAESMLSTTSSEEIATRFSRLRASTGEHCRGKLPENPVTTPCRLAYPSGGHRDGPIFLAEVMEEKWDVFLLEGELYFTRSWTGDLAYRATVDFEPSRVVVTEIRGQREPGAENPAAVVDFLIKSHVYGLVAPHPLPASPESPDDLAVWSFARYGRRGLYGTRADVTHIAVERDGSGRCSLRL